MARQVVPAYVEIDGQWVQVGTANVDITMGSADIILSDDAPVGRALVAMMTARGVGGLSIGFPTRINPEDLEFNKNEHAYLGEVIPGDFEADKTPLKTLYKDRKPGTEIHNVPTHTHKAVQHRDGKSPWCNLCGLTESFFVPLPPFTKNRGMTADRVIVDEAVNFSGTNIHITPPPPPSAAAQLQLIKSHRPEFYTD